MSRVSTSPSAIPKYFVIGECSGEGTQAQQPSRGEGGSTADNLLLPLPERQTYIQTDRRARNSPFTDKQIRHTKDNKTQHDHMKHRQVSPKLTSAAAAAAVEANNMSLLWWWWRF